MNNLINKVGFAGIILGLTIAIGGLVYSNKGIENDKKYSGGNNVALVGSLVALGSIPVTLYCGNRFGNKWKNQNA